MDYLRDLLFYEGKAKKIFGVKDLPHLVWQEFKDSFTAFNGKKKAVMKGKGSINCQIASLLFKKLKKESIPCHWVATTGEISMVTQKLEMIDLEVVVRNVLAGSTARKFDFKEGQKLKKPLVEFYYKKDELGDPFISDEQVWMLEVLRDPEDLGKLKNLGLKVCNILTPLFEKVGILLVDFKLEFGYDSKGEIVLGDEISPDSCRLWDCKTKEKMDKDRFRRDLGEVIENYQKVLDRLKSSDFLEPLSSKASGGQTSQSPEFISPKDQDSSISDSQTRAMKFALKILPRPDVLDTQGRAVGGSLKAHGFALKDCHMGKYIVLGVEACSLESGKKMVLAMAEKGLYNPLIETCQLELYDTREQIG